MRFILSAQELNYLISKIQNVISPKPTMPLLGNFLVVARNDILSLTGSDMITTVQCYTEAKILEEGATTLPAKRFAQLAKELNALNLEISTDSQDVTTISSGNSRFRLKGIAHDHYPALPSLEGSCSFEIQQKQLKELIYRTAFALSREDNRHVLTGLSFNIHDSVLIVVGTNGKLLARSFAHLNLPTKFEANIVIPLKGVEEIVKNLEDEGTAKVSLLPDKIAVESNQTQVISKLLIGDYPDVYRVIPQEIPILFRMHREELITLLRQISLFITDQVPSVRFLFKDGELRLNGVAADVGEGEVSMPLDYHHLPIEMAFSPVYFLEILRHCKNEVITMGIIDAYNPAVIMDSDQLHYSLELTPLFLIMPMRLV